MGLGRRSVRVQDASAWVFNRMAHVYDQRPPYPEALVAALVELAGPGARVLDLGAGTGQLALPLARQGLSVTAVEPAHAMLERLLAKADAQALPVEGLLAAAEALPLAEGSFELALIADALHFLDAELCALELSRVLAKHATLALVTCELGDTPFMRALVALMHEAAPRRPRKIAASIAQLAALTNVAFRGPQTFHDHTPVDEPTLLSILRSISFIGPAMNAQRAAAFERRVLTLPGPRVWSRTFTLRAGCKRG